VSSRWSSSVLVLCVLYLGTLLVSVLVSLEFKNSVAVAVGCKRGCVLVAMSWLHQLNAVPVNSVAANTLF
jgi:hypothetical protein